MTGKCYYVTTIADWRRHAGSFANSHWFLLGEGCGASTAANASGESTARTEQLCDAARIIVLVEADEGTHGRLEDDSSFTPLPHPLSSKPLPAKLHSVLAGDGVPRCASTFDVAETISRSHPLLRHRVF